MPELPEVETLRQDLSKEVVGRKVKAVAVGNGRSVRRHPSAKHFRALLEGRSIKGVGRLGKYLLLNLDNGSTLVVHLGMSGQLLRVKSAKEAKPKHTHVVITFTQGGELRYVDPRTFGEMFVSGAPEGEKPASNSSVNGASPAATMPIRQAVPELAHLGFDPVEDVMSWERFALMLRSRHGGIKALLMDQQFAAGHRQPLLRRDPVRLGPPLRPAERQPVGHRGPPPLPGHGRDPGRGDQAPGQLAGRRAVPGPVRRDRRLPGPAPGLRPRGPALPALPQPDRAGQGRRPLHLLLRALPGLNGAASGPTARARSTAPGSGLVGSPRCSCGPSA